MNRMTRFRTIFITMAAAGALCLGAATASSGATGDSGCWSDKQTQTAIAAGQIQTWSKIRKLGGVPSEYHETSDTPVCPRNGIPFYVVTMASPKGEQFKIVLNAVDGTT